MLCSLNEHHLLHLLSPCLSFLLSPSPHTPLRRTKKEPLGPFFFLGCSLLSTLLSRLYDGNAGAGANAVRARVDHPFRVLIGADAARRLYLGPAAYRPLHQRHITSTMMYRS